MRPCYIQKVSKSPYILVLILNTPRVVPLELKLDITVEELCEITIEVVERSGFQAEVSMLPNGLGAQRPAALCCRVRSVSSLPIVAQFGDGKAQPVRCSDWLGGAVIQIQLGNHAVCVACLILVLELHSVEKHVVAEDYF